MVVAKNRKYLARNKPKIWGDSFVITRTRSYKPYLHSIFREIKLFLLFDEHKSISTSIFLIKEAKLHAKK